MPNELRDLLHKNRDLCHQLKVAICADEIETIRILDAELEATVEAIFRYEPRNMDEALKKLNTLLDWLTAECSRTEREIRIIDTINGLFKNTMNMKNQVV